MNFIYVSFSYDITPNESLEISGTEALDSTPRVLGCDITLFLLYLFVNLATRNSQVLITISLICKFYYFTCFKKNIYKGRKSKIIDFLNKLMKCLERQGHENWQN